ncbi:hypothetical protein MELA_00164 [Candidatus Methylomirabilis lanthanidiphila]|uniref:Lipoprotein n=1 Tax=Candidatus Methylomirabilis lanthanidiphila TaxID=2211376 RepID=A0A564ZF67_9BACT|nr:hypothetical protein [Candidatus Methylomirabilis lanthanidiphila]VUZ83806.1 hypothetical protein MELA_00164 [Candidatus Methylomirabilis lanthanidiphila]
MFTIRVLRILTTVITLGAILTACQAGGRVVLEGDQGRVIVDVPRTSVPPPTHRGQPHGDYYRYESSLPNIPEGHLPPPGMCRIWYPDRPPGQQPPPRPCHELEGRMLPGAWLIRGNPGGR